MKVLIATPWPLSSSGGGQRLATELAGALSQHGVDVVVAAGSGLAAPPTPVVRGGPFREIRLPLAPHESRVAEATRGGRSGDSLHLEGLETVAEQTQPDVILYTPHYSSCVQQAFTVATELRVPFVLWPAIHLDHRAQTTRAAQRFYQSADLVVCLSAIERAWLEHRARVPSKRLLTLGCGWNGAPAQPRKLVSRRPVRLLTVGAFVRHKQLDHQIEALATLRELFGLDARLTIAGACREPAVAADLRQLARSRGLDGCVEIATDCPSPAIERLFAESDFFLFTSRSESFGIALLDAIGFATLPIVYPHPVYRELVESSGFGIVAQRSNPKALARALVDAITIPQSGDDRRRQRWLSNRSWPRIATLLSSALAGISRRGAVRTGDVVTPSPSQWVP